MKQRNNNYELVWFMQNAGFVGNFVRPKKWGYLHNNNAVGVFIYHSLETDKCLKKICIIKYDFSSSHVFYWCTASYFTNSNNVVSTMPDCNMVFYYETISALLDLLLHVKAIFFWNKHKYKKVVSTFD